MAQQKTEAVTIRFTPKLKGKIETAADEAGMTEVDWIRMTLRKATGVQEELGEVNDEEILKRLDEIEEQIDNQQPGFFRWLFRLDPGDSHA